MKTFLAVLWLVVCLPLISAQESPKSKFVIPEDQILIYTNEKGMFVQSLKQPDAPVFSIKDWREAFPDSSTGVPLSPSTATLLESLSVEGTTQMPLPGKLPKGPVTPLPRPPKAGTFVP